MTPKNDISNTIYMLHVTNTLRCFLYAKIYVRLLERKTHKLRQTTLADETRK